MIEEYERLLDCKNYLRENLHIFIDAFVEFYGEENRQEIEEKFSKAIFFAYREPSTTQTFLRRISELVSEEIIQKKFQELDFKDLTQEDLALRYDFSLYKSMPLYSFSEFLRLYELGPEGREKEYLEEAYKNMLNFIPNLTFEEFETIVRKKQIPEKYQSINKYARNNLEYYMDLGNADKSLERHFKDSKDIIQKIDPSMTIDIFSYYLGNEEVVKLCEMAHSFQELLTAYQDRMKKYDKYRVESETTDKIKQDLRTKYYFRLIDENIELLTDDERRIFEGVKENPDTSYNLPARIRKIFGYGIQSNHVFDAFTEESDEKIENGPEWKAESLKRERIEYFKMCGIDLHRDTISIADEYNLLIHNEEVKRLWPRKETIKKFIGSRDRLLNEYNIEFYEKQPAFIEMRQEAEKFHTLDKDDPLDATLYTGNQARTMVCPNVVKTKDGYDLFSFIMINCNNNDGIIDHNIVHELNHQFELFLQKVEGNNYTGICGWDVLEGMINQESRGEVNTLAPEADKRKYELMNEIVNELIAQDICGILQKKGQHVFDTPENARITHTTSYEETFYIIRDFYNEFKKEILESRKNGNIEVIWNKVGKENFDALNELFHIHFENFSGFKYYTLINDLKEQKDTPGVRIFNEIKEKRDQILDQMRKYSMTHEEVEVLEESAKEKQ